MFKVSEMKPGQLKKYFSIICFMVLTTSVIGSATSQIIKSEQNISKEIIANEYDSLPLDDGYTDLTVEEAWNLLSNVSNGIQIPIDVRTDPEWAMEHIDTPAPENPRHHCVCEWDNETILQEFMALYAGKEIILYCKSGTRSVNAANILVDNGFTGTIYNMLGGINAWKEAGYPTIANLPPETPTITGPTSGKAGEKYNYTISTIDPEGDVIYYYVNWSDSTSTEYLGPFESGEVVTVSHVWEEKGTYIIKVKAWDYYQGESDWATLEVSMPKSKMTQSSEVSTPGSQTELKIIDVRGGVGCIIMEIKNVGDATAEGITSFISVTGGILGMINLVHTCSGCNSCGTTLEPGAIKTESTRESGFIFGFGHIGITASAWADNANEVSVLLEGYVIGPFVIIP